MAANAGSERTISLAGSSRCEVVRGAGHDLAFRFPEQSGVLVPLRWEFSD